MITYRRNKNGRESFRIKGDCVTRIINKERHSRIDVAENYGLYYEVATDPIETIPSTEPEFTSAYKEAFDRIALMKIV